MSFRGRRISLAARWSLVIAGMIAVAIALALIGVHLLPHRPVAVGAIVLLVMLPLVLFIVTAQLRPLLALFRALGGTVTSYRDRDFAFSLHWPTNDEVRDLVDAHNELGNVLREQRLDLVQRELLLDTMVQNTPVAMMLVADRGAIVFANIAARQLLNQGRRLEGHPLEEILSRASPSLRAALDRGGDGLFTVEQTIGPGDRAGRAGRADGADGGDAGDEGDIYHLARRRYSLNGRTHELLLLRHLTIELRRQEVQTWKKVIRVISHELNNSLAPVASLANSGAELLRRGKPERLPEILATIADRTRHLEGFIAGYARFAKLPTPRRESVAWMRLIDGLRAQIEFSVTGAIPDEPFHFDVAQMEQALFNLLKNAHESGSAPAAVELAVRPVAEGVSIEVHDRGAGMTGAVMANALVPFYSTKRSGTGLGLALAREIIEAHGGRITINNRDGGGVTVALFLPRQ